MYPLKKGTVTKQAHVALPEGTFEEEHGRKGFFGVLTFITKIRLPAGFDSKVN